MGFLKKIRSNILNQQNSFHVGFGNRSPFSYRGTYAGDWTPEVPNLAASAYGNPQVDVGQMDLLKAQMDTIGKVETAITDTIKTKMETEASNKALESCEKSGGTWKNEKCIFKDNSANNKQYQKIFSDKRQKIEIKNWLKYGGDIVDIVDKKEAERKKDLEKKRQKTGIPTQEELDNIGFTH
jgi:hypothetical protein